MMHSMFRKNKGFSKPKNAQNTDYNRTSVYTPLFLAVHKGDLKLTHSLLQQNGVNYGGNNYSLQKALHGKTLIHIAAARGHEQIICLLCSRNARVDLGDRDGNTPLHLAAKANHIDVVNLLSNKNSVNLKNHYNETALHLAAVKSDIKLIEILLRNGANPNAQDADRKTPLHVAAQAKYSNLRIIELLFAYGASGTARTCKAEIPLHFSVSNGCLNIFEHLIQCGSDIHSKTSSGETPLYLAVKAGHLKMTERLLDYGADINSLTRKNCSALTLAVKSRERKILRLLLGLLAKEDKNRWLISQSEFSTEEKALHIAAENGDDEIIKMILDVGCPLNVMRNGKNALHVAAMFGRRKSVELLIKAGADINSRTETLETPLHLAAAAGRSSVVKFLLDAGAKHDLRNTKKLMPLAYAFDTIQQVSIEQQYPTNSSEKTRLLTQVISLDFISVTPFMFEKFLEVTELLVKHEVDIKSYSWIILDFPCRIRVSYQKELKFHPEIIRCILNSTEDTTFITYFLTNMILGAIELNVPQLLDVFLEYNISKLSCDFDIDCSNCDFKIILAIIDHVEDINLLFTLLYDLNVQHEVRKFHNLSKFDHIYPLIDLRSNEFSFILRDCKITLNEKTYMDILKLLVARLVLIRSVSKKFNVPGSKELKILENYRLIDWYRQCKLQIKTMREAKVHHEFDITYFDVLTKPVNKVANFVGRNDFLKILQLSYQKFPAYAKFLERSVEKGLQRKDAIDSSANCLLNMILIKYKVQLPSLVIDKIFEYLSIRDLRKLEAAGRLICKTPLYLRNFFSGKRS